jgi:hypothetical protein
MRATEKLSAFFCFYVSMATPFEGFLLVPTISHYTLYDLHRKK